jgi:amino acid transporter
MSSEKENLKREIGVRSLTLALLNVIVGTGIFVIPAIVAENLGPAAIVAYFVCGALIFLIALCFAEVGSKTTTSGGTYAYIEGAFGPFAGFIANNIFWLGSCVISDAAVANALADTLKYFFPLLNNEIFRALFFIFIFGMLALINIRGVKHGVRFIEFATFIKLIPLVLLIIAGTGFVSAENLRWTGFPATGDIGAACLLLIYVFMGIETPVTNSGEIKNPKRTVPLAIFLGISCVLVLYISIQLVTQGVLGAAISAHKDSPLGAVAGIICGKTGVVLVIITTAVSMLGGLGGEMLAVPRVLYAGARDGLMPKALAKIHPRFFTPHIAVLFYAGLGLLFAISGGFKQLATISSASTLLIYLGVVLSTIRLRRTGTPGSEKTFRVPGGIIIPLLATCVILWLLSHLTKPELTGIAIFIFVFSLIYFSGALRKK